MSTNQQTYRLIAAPSCTISRCWKELPQRGCRRRPAIWPDPIAFGEDPTDLEEEEEVAESPASLTVFGFCSELDVPAVA